MTLAKREAVSELFGEMFWSMTEVKDLVLTRDDVQSSSAGFIRMRGTPRFSNGESLGEICVSAELYVLEEDVQRLQPRHVSKKVCVADPRLSSGDLRWLAERQAQVQAVRDFEPGLQEVGDDQVLRLLHEATIEDAGFVSDTLAYCATARGLVYPIELLAATRQVQNSGIGEATAQPGASVRIVYNRGMAERASKIAERLETLGYEVTSAEAPAGPEYRRGTRAALPDDPGSYAGNRLYHAYADKEVAESLQAAIQDLLSIRLLQSRDPARLRFTLWVVN